MPLARWFCWRTFFSLSWIIARQIHGLQPNCPTQINSSVLLGTNVIVSAAGSSWAISYQHNASLPELPADAGMQVFGPALSCRSDAVITVAGPTTLDNAKLYGGQSESARKSMKLFLDWLNNERGGLQVGNKTYSMRIVLVDSASSKPQSTNATAHALRLGEADFAISEYSSSLGIFSAKQSAVEGKLMVTWGCSSTGVHSQNNLTFGIKPAADQSFLPTVDAILAVAAEIDAGIRNSTQRCKRPSCASTIKFGFIQSHPSQYSSQMCGGAAAYAHARGAQLVTDSNGLPQVEKINPRHSVQDAVHVLRSLQNNGATVLIICTNTASARKIAEAQEQIDYSLLLTGALNSNTGTRWVDDVHDGWWQGEYWGSPTTWSPKSTIVGKFTNMSARGFCETFRSRYGTEPTSNDAAAFTTLSALSAAIEAAGSINTLKVVKALENLNMQEFFARINYDRNHQTVSPVALIQAVMNQNVGDMNRAVLPPSIAGGHGPFGGNYSHFVFPTPTFAQRRCRYFGPGHTVVGTAKLSRTWQDHATLECSGHGACNDDGRCDCQNGFRGQLCEIIYQPMPQGVEQRSTQLKHALACRTFDDLRSMSLSDCTSASYVCGVTCGGSQQFSNWSVALRYTFDNATAAPHHFQLRGYNSSGLENSAAAALSCIDGAAVNVSFAQFIGNTQTGTGGTAIYITGATLNISFSNVSGNVNTGSGSSGIYATNQSLLRVSHTDFGINQIENFIMNSSSAITCESSTAKIMHSRFWHNRGTSITVSMGSLAMYHSAVHDNFACDELTSACSATSGVAVRSASTAMIQQCLFFNNEGSAAGSIFATDYRTVLLAQAIVSFGNRGLGIDVAGAVTVANHAVARVHQSNFDNNLGTSSKSAAGAILVLSSDLTVVSSTFQFNNVQGNPHLSVGAGGIRSYRSNISVLDSRFSNSLAAQIGSHASFATEMYSQSPRRVYVFNTSFQHFDDELSVLVVPGVVKGIMRGSCQDNRPCKPGFGCSYYNASLQCTPCSDTTYSNDGLTCKMCPPGSGPNHRSTGCVKCSGNNVSMFGVCQTCAGKANADHTVCSHCPSGQIPLPDNTGCQCELGTYNASEGFITCIDQNYEAGLFDIDTRYAIARDQFLNNAQCISCPSCVNCMISPIHMQSGFSMVSLPGTITRTGPTRNKTIIRCRPETAHTRTEGGGGFDGGEQLCMGGSLTAPQRCNTGHTGPLCSVCEDGFGRSDETKCKPCDSVVDPWKVLQICAIAVVACVAMGLALIALSVQFVDVYEDSDNAIENPIHQSGEEGKPSENTDAAGMADDGPGGATLITSDSTASTSASIARNHVMSRQKVFSASQRLMQGCVSVSAQPLRIFVSYWQIAAHLGAVLHFEWPHNLATLFGWFRPLVVNIQGVVALECAGFGDFYQAWLVEVIVVPIVLLAVTIIFYFWRLRVKHMSSAEAKAHLLSELFLVLFFIYPFVTNKLFATLNCRQLGPDYQVMVQSYSIDCATEKHTVYQAISVILIVVFSFGVPCIVIFMLRASKNHRNEQFRTSTWKFIQRRAMTKFGHDNLREVKYAIIDVRLGNVYGNLVSQFKPNMFYWECADMLRKLFLVGMLTAVQRGSTLQVSVGILFSFCFFSFHMRSMPYRHVEDNILKATTEAHLFCVLMLSLMLKSDLSREKVNAEDFDVLVCILFVIMVPGVAIVCVWHKWRAVLQDEAAGEEDRTHTAQLRTAFRRHCFGRDKASDRQILSDYFDKMEDEARNGYDVFISYRVASEASFAQELFDTLSAMTIKETGTKLRVYLDKIRLLDGERWDQGFMTGLTASWIVVPIVSTAALYPMEALNTDKHNSSSPDNVLLEWIAALELHARGDIKAIIPVITCDDSGVGFDWGCPKRLSPQEHVATTTACKKHLKNLSSSKGLTSMHMLGGVADVVASVSTTETSGKVTVAGVVNAILRFQGVLLSERTSNDAADRIFSKVSDLLNADTESEVE